MSPSPRVPSLSVSMVHNFEWMKDGVLAFIGRRHEPFVVAPGAQTTRNQTLAHGDAGAWVMTGEVVTLPWRREYLQELRAGGLAPADAEIAKLAGVPFAPDV
jgi:hypothetical protein